MLKDLMLLAYLILTAVIALVIFVGTAHSTCPVGKSSTVKWELVHNCIAHPLMGVSFNSRWSVRFHDYTARKAWPRG